MFYKDENGDEVELARFTKALGEKQDAYNKAARDKDVTVSVKQYDFVKTAIVTKDYLKRRLGGSSLETIDYCELSVVCIEVISAYQLRIIEAQQKANQLRADLLNGAKSRGFKNVK